MNTLAKEVTQRNFRRKKKWKEHRKNIVRFYRVHTAYCMYTLTLTHRYLRRFFVENLFFLSLTLSYYAVLALRKSLSRKKDRQGEGDRERISERIMDWALSISLSVCVCNICIFLACFVHTHNFCFLFSLIHSISLALHTAAVVMVCVCVFARMD